MDTEISQGSLAFFERLSRVVGLPTASDLASSSSGPWPMPPSVAEGRAKSVNTRAATTVSVASNDELHATKLATRKRSATSIAKPAASTVTDTTHATQATSPKVNEQHDLLTTQLVHHGRLGMNIVSAIFKSIMGADSADRYAEALVSDLMLEHAPETPIERMLVEHLAVLHAQLMSTRIRWTGSDAVDDIERLTRVQARLAAEMGRMIDTLAALKVGHRPVINQLNVGHNQMIASGDCDQVRSSQNA